MNGFEQKQANINYKTPYFILSKNCASFNYNLKKKWKKNGITYNIKYKLYCLNYK